MPKLILLKKNILENRLLKGTLNRNNDSVKIDKMYSENSNVANLIIAGSLIRENQVPSFISFRAEISVRDVMDFKVYLSHFGTTGSTKCSQTWRVKSMAP